MLTRRALLGTGIAVLSRPAIGQSPSGSFRIGLLLLGPDIVRRDPWFKAFIEECARLGYVEGKNVAYETRAADGSHEKLARLASETVASRPDVILVATTPVLLALAKEHPTVPVVFTNIGFDPVEMGIVQSLPHPGGVFTGFTNIVDNLNLKRLEMLRELLPHATRVAWIIDAVNNPAGTEVSVARMNAAAEQLGFELRTIAIKSAEDLPHAFDQVVEFKTEAYLGVAGPLFSAHRKEIVEWMNNRRLPAIYPFKDHAADGGLMSYGVDSEDLYRRAAGYVDKILRGAKPADLPVEQATKLVLVINLKTARALNLEIPRLLLTSAAELIE